MLGAAALLTAAACSDASKVSAPSSTSDLTPSFAQEDQGYLGAQVHIMPVKSQAQEAHSEAGKPGSGSGMVYHGGPVMQAGTKVAAVYWSASTIYPGGPTAGNNGAGSGDGSLVGYFMSNIGGTPYFGINSSYTDGNNQAIANSVSYTQYWANNSFNVPAGSQSVSDAQILAMLQYGFNNSKLTFDANTLYAVFTAGSVNLGGGFGTQYCAYHTHGTVVVGGISKTVLYAAMPYNDAYPGACTNGTAPPNGDAGADAEVNTLVHEIEETTTDMMANAWFDRRGYENADKCAWTWGTTYSSGGGVANVHVGTKDFLIQQNWKNSGSGGCALHL